MPASLVPFSNPIGVAGTHQPILNHILKILSPPVQQRLFPHLELVELPLGRVLYESGETLRYVYFPLDCIVSLLYVLESGASAEILVVGFDGLVGVSLFMGGQYHQPGGCTKCRFCLSFVAQPLN